MYIYGHCMLAMEIQTFVWPLCVLWHLSSVMYMYDAWLSLNKNYTVICHPSPSNNQHEHTICMNYYTLVAWLLLTPDHYQQWITVKLHIKCCTLDDKLVAWLREECMATMHCSLGHATIYYLECDMCNHFMWTITWEGSQWSITSHQRMSSIATAL